ncbi:MAG: hypothetical protein DRG76_10270 [Deltaproteobacteria bacterium]|nr:MAG: hypothetical protein DRG76_10270 [Deltaproteobacteria bacterium]
MGPFEKFVLRALLSGLFAFFLCRFFFKHIPVAKVFGLAVLMLGLAYILEYARKRDQGGGR